MKKIIFILAVAFSVCTSTFAQTEMKSGATFELGTNGNLKQVTTPVFQFIEETHDFGKVPEGPKATYEFEFTNSGNAPLIIEKAQAGCGCTTPDWPKEPVLPGQKGKISVTYNTQGRIGPFTKNVTITSNADTPSKQIFIKGEVLKAEEFDPNTSPIKVPSIVNEK